MTVEAGTNGDLREPAAFVSDPDFTRRLGRRSIGIELNPEYAELAARRLQQLSLFAEEPA